MNKFWSLFGFALPHRCFARLDAEGRCQAFKQCRQAPAGNHWIEIEEIRLNWLHQVLPASARIHAPAAHPRVQLLSGV